MILTTHLLAGAALAANVKPLPLALVLAFLSHYVLDTIPHHEEYEIKNIKNKEWRKSRPDFIKVAIDFFFGILLILIFSKNQPIIYVGAIMAVLPDGITFIELFVPNRLLKAHRNFHKKIHFAEHKKIPMFWRTLSQIAISVIAILLLTKTV